MKDPDDSFPQRLQHTPYLEDTFVNFVFNNVRNITLSVLPSLAAKTYLANPYAEPAVVVKICAYLLAGVGLGLLTLNALHGLRKISALGYPRWIIVPLAALYLFVVCLIYVLSPDIRK